MRDHKKKMPGDASEDCVEIIKFFCLFTVALHLPRRSSDYARLLRNKLPDSRLTFVVLFYGAYSQRLARGNGLLILPLPLVPRAKDRYRVLFSVA